MSFIRTLLKDIEPNELGYTYSHEHIVCRPLYWIEKNADDLLLDSPEKSKKDLIEFKNLGGNSIVDATAIDYGRDVDAVAKLAKETGLNIVGTAGFNKAFLWKSRLTSRLKKIVGDFETYEDWIEKSSIDNLVNHVVREVEVGLENTNYKAGQVKFGTGYNSITPLEIKTIRVVSRAHHKTKAPVHAHTEAGTMALQQINILKEEGVNLENVSFGHMDRNLDNYYYNKILETGAYLCFDGIGKIKYAPESHRIEEIIKLCKQGYKDKILISGDMARKSYYKNYSYGLGLSFIIKDWSERFIDEAENAGLDGQKLLNKFFIENPMKCFTFKK
ncbi:phosphotriesterase [Clostridium oceanicum]|uniref:Phosphotriesterase n=1 Tax=Clostridium oceanicum TaxID=1543 RepID=A0ABN1J9L6_9CLOT